MRSVLRSVAALAVVALMVTGCAAPDALTRPCCYEGDLTLAHLDEVRFVMEDKSELEFARVYKGFEAQDRSVPTAFPFRRVSYTGIVYDVLSVVFPEYDANQNRIIEEPELAVLYLREGAIGMGFPVSHIEVKGTKVGALQTSDGEVGGLVSYVNANRDRMSQDAQALFREIDHLATQIRRRGAEAADQTFLGP